MAKKESPFGQPARRKLLEAHFAERQYTAETAWQFVYRELLWIDGSNGLAHLYESDKVQPGRSLWYERTISFTNELCRLFGGISRSQLKREIDRLFLAIVAKLIETETHGVDANMEIAEEAEEIVTAVAESDDELPHVLVDQARSAEDRPDPHESGYIQDADLVNELSEIIVGELGIAGVQALSLGAVQN